MEPVLESELLSAVAAADVLVAFDFDGTLAPLVDDPAQAALRSGTRHLLAELAQRYPCAVISGRTEEQVRRLLGGVTVWYVVGNDYLARPEAADRSCRTVTGWIPALRRDLCRFESISRTRRGPPAAGRSPEAAVWIEDKGASLAIHYRHAPHRRKAVEAILSAAAALDDVRVIQGKQVVNLVPAGASDKGAALERLRLQLGCDLALYVGDDATDEDAFSAGPHVVGVRIGHSSSSAARYFLDRQRDVDALLERLVALRRPPGQLHAADPAAFGRRRGRRERAR
jgi:trehalose 6-phosphate phosphatase